MVIAPEHQQARSCFGAPVNAPWRWAEQGRVVVWEDGSTVAFGEEIGSLLDRIGSRRAPVFGVMVMILAACRGRLSPAMQWLEYAPEGRENVPVPAHGLDRIAALPAELRSLPEVKAEIIDMLAERMEPLTTGSELAARWREWQNGAASDEPMPVVEVWEAGEGLLPPPPVPGRTQVVCPALVFFSEKALRERLRTGLEAPPAAAELPEGLTVPDNVEDAGPLPLRDLLHELEADAAHAGLTKVMRGVLAALALPRRLSRQDDLPTGGVSDVASRGSPERLLITELAADPDVMAARLVMGEALYLRREPPAVKRDPPPLVLMDTSLRLWGLPRVFAAACALAILSARDSGAPGAVWVAEKNGCRCLTLGRVTEVAALLECLDPALDPLPGLRRWLRGLEGQPAEAERCFVTHAASLRQGAFRQALRELPALLVATVDRDGSFVLYHHASVGGLRQLCQATVALESLFAEAPRTAARLAAGGSTARRPVFLELAARPLLMAPAAPVTRALPLPDNGGIAVLETGQVVTWAGEKSGSRILFSTPEARAALLLHRIEPGRFALVLTGDRGRRDFLKVAILNLSGTPLERVLHVGPLPEWEAVTADERTLYFVSPKLTIAVSLITGDILGRLASGCDRRQVAPHGFLDGRPLRRLGWNGTEIRDTVLPGRFPPQTWMWLDNVSGLITYNRQEGLSVSGEGVTPGPQDWLLRQLVKRLESGDMLVPGPLGSRFMLSGSPDKSVYEFAPGAGGPGPMAVRSVTPRAPLTPEMFRLTGGFEPPTVPQTLHINAVVFSPDGRLGVRAARSGTWRWLILTPQPLWRRGEKPADDDPAIRPLVHVTTADSAPGFRAADWPHLRLWLDPDGFLHLVASDASIPEVTLTLSDPAMAWWLSDGAIGGREFYLPAGVTASPGSANRLTEAIRRMAEISLRS